MIYDSIIVTGSAQVSGSLSVTGGITGSFQGTATTASYVLNAVSASFATSTATATTASYVLNAVSSSFATSTATATTASYVLNAVSSSFATSASYVLNAVSASFATTAVTSSFANAFTVAGTLTAQTLVVQTITSSVVYSSGSNIFGNALSNTQVMTGSVGITGSLTLNNIAIPTSASLASTYLPLAGGTLTGALGGTSATFSGQFSIGTTAPSWGVFTNMLNLQGGSIGGTSTTDFRIFQNMYYDGGSYRTRVLGESQSWVMGGGALGIYTAASAAADAVVTPTLKFTLSNTGAATFSSSVSIPSSSGLILGETAVTDGIISSVSNTVGLRLRINTSDALVFSSTGAATFSSAVADYGLSITNVQDASQGLLVRATDNDGSLYLLNLQSSNGATSQTWVDRFAVTKQGNVGIGTASPNGLGNGGTNTTLEVFKTGGTGYLSLTSDLTASGSLLGVLNFGSTGSTSGPAGASIQAVLNGSGTSYANTDLIFYTRSTTTFGERMRITSTGKIGMGISMTSPGAQVTIGVSSVSTVGALASAALAINTNDNNPAVGNLAQISFGTQNVYTPAYIGYVITTATGYTYGDLIFGTRGGNTDVAPSERMRIKSGGYIDLNNVVYNDTMSSPRTLFIQSNGSIGGISSIRASKKNIQNVSNIDWLYQLNPVTFNYRKKDEDRNYTEEIYDEITYGLIAEDTQPIAEFLINYDDSNSDKKMIGIEYMKLITPMLKAIQEQQTLIQSLQTRITQLENK